MSASLSIEAPDERRGAKLLGELVQFDAELIPVELGWEIVQRVT
jgi:hypothetical protein